MILEKCVIGIEFGSTNIKAVMLDENHEIIASNDYAWEWMITYDPETYEPRIYEGNGQINLVRPIYPGVTDSEVLDW